MSAISARERDRIRALSYAFGRLTREWAPPGEERPRPGFKSGDREIERQYRKVAADIREGWWAHLDGMYEAAAVDLAPGEAAELTVTAGIELVDIATEGRL